MALFDLRIKFKKNFQDSKIMKVYRSFKNIYARVILIRSGMLLWMGYKLKKKIAWKFAINHKNFSMAIFHNIQWKILALILSYFLNFSNTLYTVPTHNKHTHNKHFSHNKHTFLGRKCAYNDWTQYLESEISEYLILHA